MTALTSFSNQNIDTIESFILATSGNINSTILYAGGVKSTLSAPVLTASLTWTCLAASDEVALAVASTGVSNIMYNAGTWVAYDSIPSGTAWKDMTYGNNTFVAINSNSTSAAYTNLVTQTTWTLTTLPSSSNWTSITFAQDIGSGRFLTVAAGSNAGAYSDDNGATWNAVTLPASFTWTSVKYANGYFVLIANGVANVYTSPDGINWTLYELPSGEAWTEIAWGNIGGVNGTWVAVASSGTHSAYSTDNGQTWSASVIPSASYTTLCFGMDYTLGQPAFFTTQYTTALNYCSIDGINWFSVNGNSRTYTRALYVYLKFKSNDTLTIERNSTVTVNTDLQKYLGTVTVTNGKLLIENNSTSSPITFALGKPNAATRNNEILVAGLGQVEVQGNWITIGTSNGASAQTVTSPYSRGDYIPALWVETGNATNEWEIWTNVTGSRDFEQLTYMHNGLSSVSNGNRGKHFVQNSDVDKIKFVKLVCTTKTSSPYVTCASTANLMPGMFIYGRGIANNSIVHKIINSTTFMVSALATTGYSSFPVIAFYPACYQYGTTLTFGNDINGSIPVNGARIRIPNIMLTDYTSIIYNPMLNASNKPCSFSGTGGKFTFDTCLFGESYNTFVNVESVSYNNVGACYTPHILEVYKLSFTNVGFSTPPLISIIGAGTSLGATGSTNSTTTITTPSTVALNPGMFITGTNLHACTIESITNATTAVVSDAAFGTAGSSAFTWYPAISSRDLRWTVSNAFAVGNYFSMLCVSNIYNAVFNNVVITQCGQSLTGTSTNQALTSVTNAAFNIQYSDNVTIDKLKTIQIGSSPRSRPMQPSIGLSYCSNITITDTEAYNLQVIGLQYSNNISMTNTTHSPGLFNEGYALNNAFTVFSDPEAGTELIPNTKYWLQTRSYKTIDLKDYIDGFKVCAFVSNTFKEMERPPTNVSAVPSFGVFTSAIAYGNGVWVVASATVGPTSCFLVSNDNGVNWITVPIPVIPATCYCTHIHYANSMFVATIGVGASTLMLYSTDGYNWIVSPSALTSAQWQQVIFDNGIATNKWVAISGGTAAATAVAYSTDGITWSAGTAIASTKHAAIASNGAGRVVLIDGVNAVATGSYYTTNGNSWTAGGALASSIWVSIAYGASKFVCISASATNGPTAYSTDAVAWTASTAPTLPAGMNWNKILWTGSVFVILAGPIKSLAAAPIVISSCYATSTDGITWSALKFLPAYSHWIAMDNNGEAMGFISTKTGHFAYTPDITAATPTWTFNQNVIPVWNKLSWSQNTPEFTTSLGTLSSCACTAGSNVITCTSTATLFVGAIVTTSLYAPFGSMYLGSGSGTQSAMSTVTEIINATSFRINVNAVRTASSFTLTIYKQLFQLFRSTSEGFTLRDETTLIGSSNVVTPVFAFDDTMFLTPNTPYHYRLRKLGASMNTSTNCSGTAGQATITTSGSFYNTVTSNVIEGVIGTSKLSSNSFIFFTTVAVGSYVTATGIPANTTIVSIDDFNTITISNNLTATIDGSITVGFSPAPGMYIYGSNVGLDAKIVSIDSLNSMTVSIPNTNTFSNRTLYFVHGLELPEFTCIPQIPDIVLNNVLQSNLFSSPWVASNITIVNTNTQGLLDNFVGVNANVSGTAANLYASAANGTLTQPVNVGIGPHNFSVYARARLPNLSTSITMSLSLGTTTEEFTLTNNWKRYSVNNTPTTSPTNAVITIQKAGSSIEVTHAMVVYGSTPRMPSTINTTAANASLTQMTVALTNSSAAGSLVDNASGIKVDFSSAPARQTVYTLHVGTASDFIPSQRNMVFSSETQNPGTDQLIYTVNCFNIEINNLQPINLYAANYPVFFYASGDNRNILIKNATYAANGPSTSYLYNIPAASTSFNITFHNIDIINQRSRIGANYIDGTAAIKLTREILLQNIRSNRTSGLPWNAKSPFTIRKGVCGTNIAITPSTTTGWTFATSPTIDGIPVDFSQMFDSMFNEFVFTSGTNVEGCLHLSMNASIATNKPYQFTSGNPYFLNTGGLAFRNPGDQVIITWPHKIKGVTGFSNKVPVIAGTDLGMNSLTNSCGALLVEYDLDKGSGYSGNWKVINLTNQFLPAETGIDPEAGFGLKLRLTARMAMRYTSKNTQPIIGETLWNATSNPTLTFRLDDHELASATSGLLILTLLSGNIEGMIPSVLYNTAGTNRVTPAVTGGVMTLPSSKSTTVSKLSAIRIFTLNNTNYKYTEPVLQTGSGPPIGNPSLTIEGVINGSEIRVFRTSDSVELYGIESSSGTWTTEYIYTEDVNVFIIIVAINYNIIRIDNQVLGQNGLTLSVQQTLDRAYSNP